MKAMCLRVGVVPSVNGKPSWDNDENVIVDTYPTYNKERTFDYKVVYKVWNKEEKEESTVTKEVNRD